MTGQDFATLQLLDRQAPRYGLGQLTRIGRAAPAARPANSNLTTDDLLEIALDGVRAAMREVL